MHSAFPLPPTWSILTGNDAIKRGSLIMSEPVRVFVSHHHSAEEDAFTAQLVADLEARGGQCVGGYRWYHLT